MNPDILPLVAAVAIGLFLWSLVRRLVKIAVLALIVAVVVIVAPSLLDRV